MKDSLTVADDLLFDAVEKFKALDNEGVTDDRERTRRELRIYVEYFTPLAGIAANPHSDGKNTTARAFIAEHIHPCYMLIPGAIDLYANAAPLIPPQDRDELLQPFRELLIITGERWHDVKPQALNVLAVMDEISAVDIDTSTAISQATADQLLMTFGRFKRDLRDGLKELSEALANASPAALADEMVAAIEADGEKTRSLIRAYSPNRPADYQVTQAFLSEMLGMKNCSKDRKTIQRWEKYLRTNGKDGTKPPEGYTLQTRLTLATANAWVDFYAAQENGKLKTKLSFEARFGGRT